MMKQLLIFAATLLLLLSHSAVADPTFKTLDLSNYFKDGKPSYLYVSQDSELAAICYKNATVVSVSQMKVLFTIFLPTVYNTNNHECYIEIGKSYIYVSTVKGVNAYSRSNGQQIWSNSKYLAAYGPAYSSADDVLYVTSKDGALVAMDANSGVVKWTSTSAQFSSRAFVDTDNGKVSLILAYQGGGLHCMDASTQKMKWTASNVNPTVTGSALNVKTDKTFSWSKYLYVLGKYAFYQVDLDKGTVNWKSPIGSTPSNQYFDVTFTLSSFNAWCYNASKVSRVDTSDGTSSSETDMKSQYGNGLLYYGQTIYSVGSTAVMNTFDDMTGSSSGKVTVPGANSLPTVLTDSYGMYFLTDKPSFVKML